MAVLFGSLSTSSLLSIATAQTLAGAECLDCISNKRRASVAFNKFGGPYENGQPAGWINVEDRFKCKISQDSQCSCETACALSQP